jgi:hypothetical protein
MHPNGNVTDMDKIEKVWKETIPTKWVSMVTEKKQQCGKKQKQFVDICGRTYGAFENRKKEEPEVNDEEREREKEEGGGSE